MPTAGLKVPTAKKAVQAAKVGAVSVVTAVVVVAVVTFALLASGKDAFMNKLPEIVQKILFVNMAVVAIGIAGVILAMVLMSAGSGALLV